MKLHLPVKLRASLIAAVIAVSASVYNASAANVYNKFGANDHTFTTATPNVGGNEYIAAQATKTVYYTDATKTQEIQLGADDKWYVVDANGNVTTTEYVPADPAWTATEEVLVDDGYLKFQVSSPEQGTTNYVTKFDGNTRLEADVLQFNNSLVTQDGGVEGATVIDAGVIEVNTHPVAGGFTSVNLEQVSITAGATKLAEGTALYIDNTAETGSVLDLGAVSGKGSLYITGSDDASMDSVELENLGNLGLTDADAEVTGDVAVNDLKLSGSELAVGGDVTAGGLLDVAADSTLTAEGDISSTTTTGTGTANIAGTITSTDGNITLDNGTISGNVITESTSSSAGNVTLNNVDVVDGATIDTTGDLTLTSNSTIIDTEGKDITLDVGGDLNVDNSVIDGVSGATVGGDLNVSAGTDENSDIKNSDLTVGGNISLETADSGSIDISGTVVTGGDSLSITGSNITTDETTEIKDLTGDIKLAKTNLDTIKLSTKGTSTEVGFDAKIGGSIIIESSTLANATITSGLTPAAGETPSGDISITNSSISTSVLSTAAGDVSVRGTAVTGTNYTYSDNTDNLDNCGAITGFKVALSTLGGGAATTLNSITVRERDGGTQNTQGVKLRVKDAAGNVVAISSNAESFGAAGADHTFLFDAVAIDGSAIYTYEFVSANAADLMTAPAQGLALRLQKNTSDLAELTNNANLNLSNYAPLVNAGYNGYITTLTDSTITTGAGALIISDSNVAGSTITTGEGALTMTDSQTSASAAADTVITATADSSITDSVLNGGTDVTITAGDLVITGSQLKDDVNLVSGKSVAIKGGTTVAINGGTEHDASIIAGNNLWMGDADSLAGGVANIQNADVQVGATTSIYGDNTVNLTNVYKKGDDANTASTLGTVNNVGGDAAAATLNITTNSIVDMAAIHANGGGDGTDVSKYFGTVEVKGDSAAKVAGNALIETLSVNKGMVDSVASKVEIGGDAYIKKLEIQGEGANQYRTDGTGPEVVVKGDAHIGTLGFANEGALSLVGDGTAVSTIAKIEGLPNKGTHGIINVVGGQLTTPILNNGWHILGVNGATVILGDVAPVGDALAGSSQVVNTGVKLGYLTNAAETGVTADKGQSTIKTTVQRVKTPYSQVAGPVTEETITGYTYVVISAKTVDADTTVMRPDGNGGLVETVVAAGESLQIGDQITKYDGVKTETKLSDGTVVTGVTALAGAAELSSDEMTYLSRITVTAYDEDGNPTLGKDSAGNDVVLVGQPITTQTVVCNPITETLGELETKTDGVAYLEVVKAGDEGGQPYGGHMSANNTLINAYELGTIEYWKDGAKDSSMTADAYAALTDEEKAAYSLKVVSVANTGHIKIQYELSGSNNQLNADKYITTGVISGAGNTLKAGTTITTGAISGAGNTLVANGATVNGNGATLDTGAISGANTTLKAENGDIRVGGNITSSDNSLTAGSYIWVWGKIEGDRNTLSAGASPSATDANLSNDKNSISIWDGIKGNLNVLTAEEGTITMANGDIEGDSNKLTAKDGSIIVSTINSADDATEARQDGKGNTLTASDSITAASIAGDCNILTAETITVSNGITGDYNELTAGTTITTGAINGSYNILSATTESIETGAIEGSNNTLTAGTSIETGAITGSYNTLSATTESITTGAIDGSDNTLSAPDSIKTGAIDGDRNKLLDATTIEVAGTIEGNNNELSASESIETGAIDGDNNSLTADAVVVDGVMQGDANKVSASTIVLGGASGANVEIISSGVTNTTDTAIEIGTLNTTDSTVKVADKSGAVGSISIGSMTAADTIGTTGNVITTPQGNVTIGTLEGANAKTSIEVGKLYSITVTGADAQTTANTASNQSWSAGTLAIGAATGLSLTDSTLTIVGDITGTSLGLGTSAATAYASTAANVKLSGALAISGNATLTTGSVVTGSVTLANGGGLTATSVDTGDLSISGSSWLDADTVTAGDLTISGTGATLKGDPIITVTGNLTLTDGATLKGTNIKTDADGATLTVVDSILTSDMLLGFTGVTLQNSTGNVTGGLTGLTEDVIAEKDSVLKANEISTAKQVIADASTIETTAKGISANKGVTATNGGSIKSAAGITSTAAGVTAEKGGSIVATGDISAETFVKADGGTISATNITAGSMEIANNGSITTGVVTLEGDLNAAGGKLTAASVSGAEDVTLNGADITGALEMTGTLTDQGSKIGSVSGATDATLTGTKVGSVEMTGELTADGATIDSVAGATNATLTNNTTIKDELEASGDVVATGGSIGSITGGATSVELTGTKVGSVEMGGELTADGATIDSVDGATNATLTDTTIKGDLEASGSVVAEDSKIGSITGAASVELTGTTVGDIDMAITGDLTVTGGSTGAITNGTVANATLTNTTIGSGLKVTNNMTSTGKVEVKGDVTVGGDLAVNTGTLTAENVTVDGTTTLTGGSVVADTFHSTNVELVDIVGEMDELIADEGLSLSGTTVTVKDEISVGKDMTLTSGANVTNNGTADIEGDLTVTDSIFTNKGAVEVGGATKVTDGTLTGATLATNGLTVDGADKVEFTTITSSDDVTVKNATLVGNVTTTGTDKAVSVTNGAIGGKVTATGGVTLSNAETGTVDADGDVTATTSTINGTVDGANVTLNGSTAGTVTATGDVTLSNAETGAVDADGDVTATTSTINGTVDGANVELAGSTVYDAVTAEGTVKVAGTIITGDVAGKKVTLSDSTVGALKATEGATLAHSTINGALIAGDTVVSSDVVVKGSADVDGLTVNKGSSLIAADVTADGELDIQGAVMTTTGNVALTGAEGSSIAADVTAAGDVIIAGTVAATEAALKGAKVTIDGTLAAGKGVSFIGTVNGAGTIVKTGGDTLALAGDTKIGGVTVKGSTLDVAHGADLGKLTVSDKSTVEIAGEGMGTVKVAAGSKIENSTVQVDLSLDAKNRTAIEQVYGDKFDGSVDLTGSIVVLSGDIDENAVKDQDKHILATGTLTGNFDINDDAFDTLNVHAEGGNLVFSKNFKGAQNKTENQAATADALTSLGDKPAGELGKVMEALKSTRSEAEALKALDSLSGAGLSAAPKLIADETKEHLQTLRSTLQSVAAGLERRYTASGLRLDSIESTGVTASVTGGSSTVKEDGNAPEYSRNSVGAMLTTAHAINDEWVFGAALSFSQADADCGATTIESQGVFVDVGVMQKRGRFTQMGSIGCAFFSMDTERTSLTGTGEGSTDAAAFTMTYETTYAIWQTETYSFSSVVMAEMLFAQVDNMEEEGLGNAGLRSSFDDVASFTFGAGARYTLHFGEETNPGYLSLEAMAVADTGDSTTKVNNTFIGGGNSFQLSGPEAGNYGLRLNAGVLVPLGDQWGLFGNATGEFRSEQSTVGGSVGVKCTF